MIKREANNALIFRHWLRAHPQSSAAYEIKQTTKDYISWKALEEHQENYLLSIAGDDGALVRVQGTNGEPDYIYLRNQMAYIVIFFPGEFHIIEIFSFIDERDRFGNKSLTKLMSRKISTQVVKIPSKNGIK